jgi:hypothetical protein
MLSTDNMDYVNLLLYERNCFITTGTGMRRIIDNLTSKAVFISRFTRNTDLSTERCLLKQGIYILAVLD